MATGQDLMPLAELSEAQAYGSFWEVASTLKSTYPFAAVRRWDGATIGRIGPIDDPYPLWELIFNSVIGLGMLHPATESLLDRIGAFYQQATTRWSIRLTPTAQPAELLHWLDTREVRPALNIVKCYRNVEAPPTAATDLRIERIKRNQPAAYTALAAPVLALQPVLTALVAHPDWHHYVAFDGALPVACASLFVHRASGWLGWAFTMPSHRRRGAQSALLVQRIRDAAALGCRWLYAETSEETPDKPNPSYHNMLRAGFQVAYRCPIYVA